MITKTIEIDGKPVEFKASASVPRLYRAKFGRDFFKDMSGLAKSYRNKIENQIAVQNGEDVEEFNFDIKTLDAFENISYIMAKHADPKNTPETADEWLEQFNMFSIYEIYPQMYELWGLNEQQTAECKKKLAEMAAK